LKWNFSRVRLVKGGNKTKKGLSENAKLKERFFGTPNSRTPLVLRKGCSRGQRLEQERNAIAKQKEKKGRRQRGKGQKNTPRGGALRYISAVWRRELVAVRSQKKEPSTFLLSCPMGRLADRNR